MGRSKIQEDQANDPDFLSEAEFDAAKSVVIPTAPNDAVGAPGISTDISRADHKHPEHINTPTADQKGAMDSANTPSAANAFLTSSDLTTTSYLHQTVEDTTLRITISEVYVDLPAATITINQGAGEYLIVFTASIGDSGLGTKGAVILSVNGVDKLPTKALGKERRSLALHWRGSLANTQVVKIRFKRTDDEDQFEVENFVFSAHRTS